MEYRVGYAFDCPCYGATTVEADTPEEAVRIIKRLHQAASLVDEWEPSPEAGLSRHRVTSVSLGGVGVVDAFSLDEEPAGDHEPVDTITLVTSHDGGCQALYVDGRLYVGHEYSNCDSNEIASAFTGRPALLETLTVGRLPGEGWPMHLNGLKIDRKTIKDWITRYIELRDSTDESLRGGLVSVYREFCKANGIPTVSAERNLRNI